MAQKLGGIVEIQPLHYGTSNGKRYYRDKALEFYGEKCEICGYSEHKEALQVHHIDSDRENNTMDNLIVLCANHHALLTLKVAILENRQFLYVGV